MCGPDPSGDSNTPPLKEAPRPLDTAVHLSDLVGTIKEEVRKKYT